MENEVFGKLKQAVMDGDSEALCKQVNEVIDKIAPLDLVQKGMMPGMQEIGDKFSEGEVFLPELLMAAEAWEDACRNPVALEQLCLHFQTGAIIPAAGRGNRFKKPMSGIELISPGIQCDIHLHA